LPRDNSTGKFSNASLTGKVIGKLTVLDQVEGKRYFGYTVWNTRCECGNTIERHAQYLALAKLPACDDCKEDNASYITAIQIHTKISAKSRGLEFDLTKEQVRSTVTRNCQYCGIEPTAKTMTNLHGSFAFHGIDRVDNLKGYTIDNVVPCCSTCNMAKAQMTIDEFRAWVKRIYRYMYHA
jgi:hypothetical protein